MEKLIKKYNKELYDNNYNENMISTKEVFIKFYQDFLKDNPETGLNELLEGAIKDARESKNLYVVDCLILGGNIDTFSTVEELEHIMNKFDFYSNY